MGVSVEDQFADRIGPGIDPGNAEDGGGAVAGRFDPQGEVVNRPARLGGTGAGQGPAKNSATRASRFGWCMGGGSGRRGATGAASAGRRGERLYLN